MGFEFSAWKRSLATCLILTVSGSFGQTAEPGRTDVGFLLGEAISAAAEPIPGADDSQPVQREFKSALTRRTVERVANAAPQRRGDSLSNSPAVATDETSPEEASAAETEATDSESITSESAPSDETAGESTDHGALGWQPKPEVIQERYPNRKIRVEREVTQDERGNYLNHGAWKMWDPKGNFVAEGQFVDGERQGAWYRWHNREDSPMFSEAPYNKFTPPFVSQATFQNGKLHGAWIIADAKQLKISEWNFEDGQRHGKSSWWHANGQKLREMSYKAGAIDGEVLEWNEAAQVVTRARFQEGRKLAPRTESFKTGEKRSEGTYLHASIVLKSEDDWWSCTPAVFTTLGKDERHGDWISWYTTGQEQMRGRYQHDKEEGVFTWWYPNGQKAVEGEFVHGLQNGAWVWWHKNGQKATQGNYQSGEQNGRWTVWNETGKVTQAQEHNAPGTADDTASTEKTDDSASTGNGEDATAEAAPETLEAPTATATKQEVQR